MKAERGVATPGGVYGRMPARTGNDVGAWGYWAVWKGTWMQSRNPNPSAGGGAVDGRGGDEGWHSQGARTQRGCSRSMGGWVALGREGRVGVGG